MTSSDGVTITAVTESNWDDLEALFERPGPRGGTPMPGSCWCMWWRERSGDADRNKEAMRAVVRSGPPPGLIAAVAGTPAGWVSIAPRETYGQLMRSPSYRPRDTGQGVFTVACLYVDPRLTGRHLAEGLLAAAVAHARNSGATAVEGYPNDRGDFMGSRAMFERAGFTPARRAGKRTIMRIETPTG